MRTSKKRISVMREEFCRTFFVDAFQVGGEMQSTVNMSSSKRSAPALRLDVLECRCLIKKASTSTTRSLAKKCIIDFNELCKE